MKYAPHVSRHLDESRLTIIELAEGFVGGLSEIDGSITSKEFNLWTERYALLQDYDFLTKLISAKLRRTLRASFL